jgi:hypothetical protein
MASPRCAYCRTQLALGTDVLAVTRGVVGPRGFIPLEEPVLVCSEVCLARYAEPVEDGPPPRIP